MSTSNPTGSKSMTNNENGSDNLYEVQRLAAQRLAATQQRYTQTRQKIVEALHQSAGPLTISDLLAKTGLAQSSTYRNLVLMEESEIVKRIVTSDDFARYELTEDITGYHHHHLICEQCGIIHDIHLSKSLETKLGSALDDKASEVDFHGTHHRVDLLGTCGTCVSDAAGTANSGADQ